MKRITTILATGALGMTLMAPCALAQSAQDMRNDENAIENGHQQLHHDRNELRNDLSNGDYGAAADEQQEMNQRRQALRERQEDLNNDAANRASGDEDANGAYGNEDSNRDYNDEDQDYANRPHRGHHHHHDKDND